MNYDIVYVLSGGKTGSQTLYASFRRLHPITIHTHDALDVIHSTELGKKILIVNSYREPVSRHLSSFLFTLNKTNNRQLLRDTRNFQLLRNMFEGRMAAGDYFEGYHPLVVFLTHYQKPLLFDKIQKWHFQKFVLPNVDCLKLRFDHINLWESQIRNVFPRFRLVPLNLSETKDYYPFYKHFKSVYHPSHFLLSRLFHDQDLLLTYFQEHEILELLRGSNLKNPDDISLFYHRLVDKSPSST